MKETLTPSVKPLDVAFIEPDPAVVVTERSAQLAAPAVTVFVRLELLANVPHVAPEPFAKVTEAVELSVHSVPDAF